MVKNNEKSTRSNSSRITCSYFNNGGNICTNFYDAEVSLKTEREVSIKNDVQREARFIMEYVTEKMRDKDMYWFDDGAN